MTTETFILRPRRAGKTAEIHQLVDAYQRARLRGTVEAVLANPTLVICLQNIVASNQADPNRTCDMVVEGDTVFIAPIARPITHIHTPKIDRMRAASGDIDED